MIHIYLDKHKIQLIYNLYKNAHKYMLDKQKAQNQIIELLED